MKCSPSLLCSLALLCSLIQVSPSLSDVFPVNQRSLRLHIFVFALPWDSPMSLSLSKTKAVCSHPVNFINPNLGSMLDAPFVTGSKNTHEQLHTRPDTHSVWSIVVFLVSPWKQPVQQHSHTAAHWFTDSACFELAVGFGSAFQDKVNSQHAADWHLSFPWPCPH